MNCYAERGAANPRLSGLGKPYEGLAVMTAAGPRWGQGKVQLVEELLDWPLHRRKPLRIFVNSMSDLFHEALSDEVIAQVFGVMAACPQHIFQIVTKRPCRMLELLQSAIEGSFACVVNGEWAKRLALMRAPRNPAIEKQRWGWPIPNLWLGVSVEDQATADERIPLLLQTPAAVRWISAEPLLAPIDLKAIAFGRVHLDGKWQPNRFNLLEPITMFFDEGDISLPGLDWVVVGGESGPHARPMHPEWARQLRDQCMGARVPFFFKQCGEWAPGYVGEHRPHVFALSDGTITADRQKFLEKNGSEQLLQGRAVMLAKVGKKRAGRELDGREWNEFPIHSRNVVPPRIGPGSLPPHLAAGSTS